MSTAPSSPATSSEFGTLSEEHWIEPLNDGSHVLIRPLKPEDRQREADFIAGLSAEARHFRFLCSMREVSPALLDQLMAVNFKDSVAYIAVAHQDGKLIEVGVSRYAVGGDGEQCECAITVADAWRHRGLAVALMRHLIETARRNGLKQMFSLDSAANTGMHELVRFLGFTTRQDPNDATQVIHTLSLQPGA
ncbi:GNAT family N-acetyltransferase [Pseudomonas panipatensis]|uniref:Acetyltransferase (GNAT) family protein n=1 Tax=Pseudomonas panipatensis TaxID=428992 RepID=A0A1G8FSU2_9PSED|nr:GNAT family N-acetyltransferase [Pseudomonas panipatensis]SDH85016.1 Acetyltransferase (GNAT) family protein [Pseudomonas panipatensis]SMP52418.1 Acetyltransferase (GNAT) family protein [Pseudomonas panipatensis]